MDIPEKYKNLHSDWFDLILKNKQSNVYYDNELDIKLNTPGAYVLFNPDTLEFYIGSSKNILSRLIKHNDLLLYNCHFNLKVKKSFIKSRYFQVLYLPSNTREEAYDIEQDLINANLNNPLMMNVSIDVKASRKGLLFSEESKQKMRDSWNPERRINILENIKKAHKVIHSDEALKIQSERMKGNTYGVGQGITEERREFLSKLHSGKILSEETKQKISETKKEAFANGCKRPRAESIMVNGIRYVSCNEAGKYLDLHSGVVWYRVNSKNNKYQEWKYV